MLVLVWVCQQFRLDQTTQRGGGGRDAGLPSSTAMDDDAMGIQPTRKSPSPQMIRPDWPRWINSARVDDEFMLSAFLEYVMKCSVTAKEEVAKLYSIEHRVPQRMGGLVPSIPCIAKDCERCKTCKAAIGSDVVHGHGGRGTQNW